jgi:hypothetical protein
MQAFKYPLLVDSLLAWSRVLEARSVEDIVSTSGHSIVVGFELIITCRARLRISVSSAFFSDILSVCGNIDERALAYTRVSDDDGFELNGRAIVNKVTKAFCGGICGGWNESSDDNKMRKCLHPHGRFRNECYGDCKEN